VRAARRVDIFSFRELSTMSEEQIRGELRALVQLDVDAVHAYGQVIAAAGVLALRDALGELRRDHQRHVEVITEALAGLGDERAPPEPDLRGRLLGGMTAMRALAGMEAALHALRDDEQVATVAYARALAKPLPEPYLELVRRGHADEHRHLETVERWIAARAWESTAHV